ncbi:MAG: HNH endonuclease [Acidimicrobiales bacterium]
MDTMITAAEQAMRDLDLSTDAIAQISLLGLRPDELEAWLCDAIRVRERLSGVISEAISHAERSGLAAHNRTRSLTTHLASVTGGNPRSIGSDRALALWLDHFLDFGAAWAAGELTRSHLIELRKIDNPRTRPNLVRDQQVHIDNAQQLSFPEWIMSLDYWLLHADPDGTPDKENNRTRYGVRVRRHRDGSSTTTMDLDPLDSEAFEKMLDHEAAKIRQAESEAETNDSERLPIAQRNTLALLRLMARGFKRTDGSFPDPLIHIVMSEQVAEDVAARVIDAIDPATGRIAEFDPFERPLDWTDIDKRCETIRGTPLDPLLVLPALLIGRLRRQVIGAEGRTLDLGTNVRLFPKWMKHALLVESRGRCARDGCDAPFSWLHADHRIPHIKGGSTSVENGDMVCDPENGWKGDNMDRHPPIPERRPRSGPWYSRRREPPEIIARWSA